MSCQVGVVFAPLAMNIKIVDKAVDNLFFSLIKVTVSGRLQCKSATCPDLTVSLQPSGFGQQVLAMSQGGKFVFENLLPGTYTISIDESGLCWERSSLTITVETDPVDSVVFVQTGWVMMVTSSHETRLNYQVAMMFMMLMMMMMIL